ncbi:hypothetical protein [Halobacteriovorax sp. HLS]|uniref:hypothetical protein n=1 Tax=Halobacteriovorax sp. HLS TaxID=2234000 RepID=UPI000FDAFC99|nr:hypothetical protein [Halobacteriovorax sp. HLS]
MKVFLVFFFLVVNTFASVPSVEGLFRNPNSQDIDGNLVVITASIQKEKLEEEETQSAPKYLKFLFGLEEEKVQFLQVEYSEGKMDKKNVVSTLYLKNFLDKVKNDELLERNIFYSLLMMYGLNKSDGISGVLKKHSSNFISNKDSLNKDKVELYDRYKRYLLAIRNDETIKDQLNSPMESEDEEEKKKISEIKSKSMYEHNDVLSLEKEGREFVLNLKLDGVSAKFTNEEHRLLSLKVNKGTSEVETHFSDYILFNGRHELPKFVQLKDQSKAVYRIRFLGYSVLNSTNETFSKRALQYKEIELENKKNAPKPEAEVQEKQQPESRPIIIY